LRIVDVLEESMNRIKAAQRARQAVRLVAKRAALAAMLTSALMAGAAHAAREYNLQPPVTVIGEQIVDLHVYIMWISVVIFVGVFAVMFYSIFAHRKSKGHQAAQFHENTTVEVVWTIIPFLILVGMALPATRTILEMKDTTVPDVTIKVTGYQWKWGYDYIDQGFGFVSNLKTPYTQIYNQEPKSEHYLLEVDQPMVVPAGKKIRVLITAGDVIHSWWVPAFGVKQDAIPGFVRDAWFRVDKPGIYRGQCAELCGKEHGFMPVVVEVVPADQYAAWVDAQKKKSSAAADDPAKVWDAKDLIARGESVYTANCASCHQATGKGLAPAFPPLDGSKIATGPVAAHLDTVLNGVVKNGQATAMLPFKNTLSPTEIAAVVTYERNAWGNHVGDAVQPSQVVAAKQ
jgi:cytochrome c oxidase subunit II